MIKKFIDKDKMSQEEINEEMLRRFNFNLNYNPAKPSNYPTLEESILFEGINIDKFNKTVEYDDSHEKGVVTGNYMRVPDPVYSRTKEGYPVISIFERTTYESYEKDDPDSNPLIHAMKGVYKWKFKNGKSDIYRFFRRFVQIAQGINPNYETIIMTPSKSDLNEIFLDNISRIIKCKHVIKRRFVKVHASEIFDLELINYVKIKEENPNNYVDIAEKIEEIIKTQIDNGDEFSFKTIPVNFRKYIGNIIEQQYPMLDLEPKINGKDILILDDTVASGTTISRMCDCVLRLYKPKSITIITLFSGRN